jgi:hypothetical protein
MAEGDAYAARSIPSLEQTLSAAFNDMVEQQPEDPHLFLARALVLSGSQEEVDARLVKLGQMLLGTEEDYDTAMSSQATLIQRAERRKQQQHTIDEGIKNWHEPGKTLFKQLEAPRSTGDQYTTAHGQLPVMLAKRPSVTRLSPVRDKPLVASE